MKGIKINWQAVPDAFKMLGKYGKDHAPSILVGLGILSLGASLYFTADRAPKAKQAIEAKEAELEEGEELTVVEKIKIAGPYYIPAAGFAGINIACNVAAQKINLTRLSSLGAMYALARNDLKEIKDKIIETDGQKKLDEINHAIANDVRTNRDLVNVYETGRGDTIFIDKYLNRAFKTSPTAVNNALTEMNTRLMVDGEFELSEFLYSLGLPWADAGCAKNAVFRANTATDVIHGYQILDYGSVGCGEANPVVCVMNYEPFLCPTYDFDARTNKYDC